MSKSQKHTRKLEKIDHLKPAPYNPREISDEALEGLRTSLAEFGDLSGIVWSADRGHLICGHQRIKALQDQYGEALQWRNTPPAIITPDGEEFSVRVISGWTPAKEKAANVTANAPTIHGVFTVGLNDLLDEINSAMPELFESLDFESLTIPAIPEALSGQTDPDDVPEPPDEAASRRGEVYQLGDHRLMCGDSGSAKDLDTLLAGDLIDLVNMDPPYNVKVEPRSNNAIAAGMSSFSNDAHGKLRHHQSFDMHRYKLAKIAQKKPKKPLTWLCHGDRITNERGNETRRGADPESARPEGAEP